MTTHLLNLFISGDPAPQPRARAGVTRYGKAMVFKDPAADSWKQAVGLRCRSEIGVPVPVEGPLMLTLHFILPHPADRPITVWNPRTGKAHTRARPPITSRGAPDLDNLEKAAMDALTDAGIWCDDAQVTTKLASKRTGDRPGVLLVLDHDPWPQGEEGPRPEAQGPREEPRAPAGGVAHTPRPGAQGPGPTQGPSSWPHLPSNPDTSLLIMEAAAESIGHGVTVSDMLGNGRMPDIRHARLVAAYIMRHHQHLSFPEIAERMNRGRAGRGGNSGHSGCLGLVRTGQSMLDAGGEVAALFLGRLKYTYSTVRAIKR